MEIKLTANLDIQFLYTNIPVKKWTNQLELHLEKNQKFSPLIYL